MQQQQQLPGQVRPANPGQAAGQLTAPGSGRCCREAPPPHGQHVKGLSRGAVPSSQLPQLGGAAAQT